MTPFDAEKIIIAYSAALARGADGGIARKLSWLPCSVCRIRHAFYVYLKELIVRKQLLQEVGDQLKGSYTSLNQFIADEDADTINIIHSKIKFSAGSVSEDERQLYFQFTEHAYRSDEQFEINSYINECFSRRDNQDWILQ